MGDWAPMPEYGWDELKFGVFSREELDNSLRGRNRAHLAAPEGFIPERLKGPMQERQPRTEASKLKAQEMAERADLIRWGMMPYLIAEAYGVSTTSIKEQTRNMKAKEGTDGRSRTSTEAESRRGAGGESGQTPAAGGDEATSEAAA